MFNHIAVEAQAIRAVNTVLAKQRGEDSAVELKSAWPDNFAPAARQLAGLVNAASTPHVMWIVGVDEDKGAIVPFEDVEVAQWWAKVKRWFDLPAPLMRNFISYIDGKRFVVLVFETDGRPFVVKKEGGPDQFIVPWREGNDTRTAKRHELIQLLQPLQTVPDYDLLSFTVRALRPHAKQGQLWHVRLRLYVDQDPTQVLSLPKHRVACRMEVPEFRYVFDDPTNVQFIRQGKAASQVQLTGAGEMECRCDFLLKPNASHAFPDRPPLQDIVGTFTFRPARSEAPLVVERQLAHATPGTVSNSTWGYWLSAED